MNLDHFAWPLFEDRHRAFASQLAEWAGCRLGQFEADEGNDGQAARRIFQELGASGWLGHTLPMAGPDGARRLDLRSVSILCEISAHVSVIADVGLSEPWMGALRSRLPAATSRKAGIWRVTGNGGGCRPSRYLSPARGPTFRPSKPRHGWMAANTS